MSKEIILLPKLIRKMDKAFCDFRLDWTWKLLHGVKPITELEKRTPYFTQRLSAGSLGSPCWRKIFYQYHHVAIGTLAGEKLRLFNSGFVIENQLIANLLAAGIDVSAFNPKTDKQWEFTAFNNKLVSKLDGIFPKGLPYLIPHKCNLEIKGVNDAKFTKFVKSGVEKIERRYYVQMQVGMSLSRAKYCVFLVMNKNNSKLYAEQVEFDKPLTMQIAKNSKKILDNPTLLPPKKPDYCFSCAYANVCKGGEVLKRCRTCKHYVWDNNTCSLDGSDRKYGDPCEDKYQLLKMTGEW